MNFEPLTDRQILNNRSPHIIQNFSDWYRFSKTADGAVVLDEKALPFLSSSMICGLDVSEIRCPSIGYLGTKSLASLCMADKWVKTQSGLTISDPKISAHAAAGYLKAIEGHLQSDIVEAEAVTPAFGKVTLTYFRSIIPVQTKTGKFLLMVVCQPIGDLEAMLAPNIQYRVSC